MALWLSRAARKRHRWPPPAALSSLFPLSSPRQNSNSPFSGPRDLGAPIPPRRRPCSWPPRPATLLDGLPRSLSLASIYGSSGSTREDGGPRSPDGEARTAAPPSWVDAYLPVSVRPYALLARLDKPIGTWLLAWPCGWSITMAATHGNLPDIKMLALFGCGAVLLRGAGCTVNDLLDRDIDIKVERTKYRPIASGVLTPFRGLCFLGFQLLLGLGILLQLNNYSRILGASSLLLVFSYPLMKRLTFWPQAYLGLTFNWGALLGWAAVKESLDPAVVLPLYGAGVCWTLVYDTIYAHQDKEDDQKVGVKSTALRFGSFTKYWITGFGIACVSNLGLSGCNAELAWPFYPFLVAAAGQLGWQILTVDLSNRADCNRKMSKVSRNTLNTKSIFLICFKQVVRSSCIQRNLIRSSSFMKVFNGLVLLAEVSDRYASTIWAIWVLDSHEEDLLTVLALDKDPIRRHPLRKAWSQAGGAPSNRDRASSRTAIPGFLGRVAQHHLLRSRETCRRIPNISPSTWWVAPRIRSPR
ncbi:hypothetical protein OPV22_008586 [Ensete ventricosum]|uniref:4-hydroxybenzoate polyprenyltransferase, mitochondrial n=1 Tax=Ensete ventricosum TaxID=4639 RepID=A0AAV8R8Q2_ENSVE|nr:hypothetical protein OPV22_008586 [Ensete ventricosum]